MEKMENGAFSKRRVASDGPGRFNHLGKKLDEQGI